MVNDILSDTIKQANKTKFRYDNIKSLLNRYIATGLMPGYFDIYNDLQDTKHKLKEARKEAAATNKRYKRLKKEFDQYRNKHTESDCNPYLAKIRDLEQQIESMNAHRERMNETKARLEYVRDHADEMTHEEIVAMIRGILQKADKEENYEGVKNDATG